MEQGAKHLLDQSIYNYSNNIAKNSSVNKKKKKTILQAGEME